LLHTDAGPRHVRCYHLTPDGASYAVDREDMVTSTDNWFRPSDVCVAPDGSVYIADWYDPGVGGHGMGDTTRGRIFRLAPKGNKPSIPAVDLQTREGITTALASPALSVRYMAMAKLHTLKKEEALAILKPATEQQENVWLRARALWQQSLFGDMTQTTLALADADPRFRTLALRIFKNAKLPVSPAHLGWQSILQDASPALCREALLLVRDVDPALAKPLILELAKRYDGKDRFYLEAIGIAIGKEKNRREFLLADFDKHFPEWNEKVLDLIWELQPPGALGQLEKRLGDTQLPVAQRGRIVEILAASDAKDAGMTLVHLLQTAAPQEVRDKALDTLKLHLAGKWRLLRENKDFRLAVDHLVESEAGRCAGLALIAAAERTDATPCVHTYVLDAKQPAAVRREAVRALGRLPTPAAVSALEAFLYLPLAKEDHELAQEAVLALAAQSNQRGESPSSQAGVKALQTAVLSKDLAGDLKPLALIALAGTRPGATWLLDLHAKGKLPEDLHADTARLLRNSPYPNLRNRALTAFPPPGKLNPKKLPSLAALAARRGNAGRGKELFIASAKNDMQCMKCHTIRGHGGQVGPDLSMIGKKASRENLFESILFPSKAIADQYVSWQIESKKGVSLVGLLIEETPDSLTLRDGNGQDRKIAKKDIETREKTLKSLMPEDLLAYMTEEDLIDTVEYLFTLKTPSLGMDFWHIAGPFDNGAADAGLDHVFPPEKAIEPKAVYTGKAGPVTWRKVHTNAQGYVDLQAFFAPNSKNIVSYLYRDIESPADQDAEILLGVDDCAKLWLNDSLVHTSRDHAAARPEQFTLKVKLQKGSNRILIKINNGDGPHGFYFTMLAEQEVKRLEER
jgi:putative heme-binding domain-containing protein